MPVPVKKPRPAESAAAKPDAKAAPVKPFKAHASRLVSSKIAYKGLVFNVHSDTVQEPNGFVHKREVIHHVGSVVILAIDETQDPKDPIVILERQYRHAVGKFLLELPAGRIEPKESPLAAAKREMIEETGYRAKRWTPLAKYYASPGFLGERMQIYLARDIREGTAQPEADEQIEILRIPLSEAMALVHSNKIQDGKTLIGLFSLESALRAGRL
jgi:ADP-ribose pyrophosphatase